jgi:hypothetical protein
MNDRIRDHASRVINNRKQQARMTARAIALGHIDLKNVTNEGLDTLAVQINAPTRKKMNDSKYRAVIAEYLKPIVDSVNRRGY